MASRARGVHCELGAVKPAATPTPGREPARVPAAPRLRADRGKIVLQPRLCTLRSYGEDRPGVAKPRKDGGGIEATSPFFEALSEYIESSRKSRDFEIISGRLAMIVFAATLTTEFVTGNSVFSKMDLQGIEEAVGVCLGAATTAAFFAWISSARTRVGRIFTITCNSFIDSLIDEIVDGLFYESELGDWSDDI